MKNVIDCYQSEQANYGTDYSVTCSVTTEVKSFAGIFQRILKPGSKKFSFSNVSEVVQSVGVLQNRRSLNFCNILRKANMPEPLFKKVVLPEILN